MLSRRSFLAATASATAAAQSVSARPNVLFISVDDMNDWVGCLGGYPGIQTPNIDALARRGALFANAHCASPLCNPSRTALLTGRRASTTGIYNNDQFWPAVLPDIETLPRFFRKHGYTVAVAGKVFHHTAGNNPPSQWDEFQLQEFDDPWYRRADWYPWNKKIPAPPGHPFNGLDDFPGEFDWGVPPAKEEAYGDQKAIQFGQRFLARKHEKPFFLAVGLWHPHIPMYAPQNYFDLYPPEKVRLPEAPENDLDDVPAPGQEMAAFRRVEHERIVKEGKWKDAVRSYLACISFADAMVGSLLSALDKSAHAKNTVIVFWSDNGWHLGEKRHWHKSTLWQRSTHVPLIFAGPGVSGSGTARRQAVSLLDIYPTLADLCGLPKSKSLEGISLQPQLKDAKSSRPPAVITYLQGNHAVRDEKWRYIRYRDGSEELYDCVNDPNEWRNLAGDQKLADVKTRLARFLPQTNVPPQPQRTEFDFDFATHTYRRKQ